MKRAASTRNSSKLSERLRSASISTKTFSSATRSRSRPSLCTKRSSSPTSMVPVPSTSMAAKTSRSRLVASSSMKSRGHIPSTQPIEMPIIDATATATRADEVPSCAGERPGSGRRFAATFSMTVLAWMPTTSDTRLPRPAAASAERPSVAPNVASIESPAVIMIALSRKPKPMNGIPILSASRRSCWPPGAASEALPVAAAAASAGAAADAYRRVVQLRNSSRETDPSPSTSASSKARSSALLAVALTSSSPRFSTSLSRPG